jgi:hypothetical protein
MGTKQPPSEFQRALDALRVEIVKRTLARRGFYLTPKATDKLAAVRSYERYAHLRVPIGWLDLNRSWRALLRRWFR